MRDSRNGITFAVAIRKLIAIEGDSLAQQVEHIPFKDGVLGSSPRRITKAKRQQQKHKSYKINILWDFFIILPQPLPPKKKKEGITKWQCSYNKLQGFSENSKDLNKRVINFALFFAPAFNSESLVAVILP